MIRLIVKLRRWSHRVADRVLKDCGALDGGKRLSDIGVFRALAPEDQVDTIIERLNAHPAVRLAGLEPEMQSWAVVAYQSPSSEGSFPAPQPDPPPLPHSWHESRHAIGRAKQKPLVDTTLRVGVTDTGVLDNEDLPLLPAGRRYHVAMDSSWPGDGVKTAFSYAFPCVDTSTIRCYIDGVQVTPVSIAPNANPKSGGTVTFATAPANMAYVWIQGDADRYDDLFLYVRGLQTLGARYSHGTAVLGVISANSGNGVGVSGIASELPACFVATSGGQGGFTGLDCAEALMVAAGKTNEVVNGHGNGLGCLVVNCSWGEDRDNSSRFDIDRALWNPAFNYAAARDVLVVVSTGNDGLNLDTLFGGKLAPPFDHPAAFAVGGIQEDDGIAFWPRHQHGTWTGYSRYGSRVEITAAASYVWSTGMDPAAGLAAAQAGTGWNPALYWNFGGTSCAAPVVAGVAARVRATNPALTAEQTRQIIKDTADTSRNPTNYNQWFPNAGILNAAKAVAKAAALRTPGSIHPHIQFFKPGPYTRLIADFANPTDGPWIPTAPGGSTTLNGPVEISMEAYSTEPITSVELWVGGVRKYIGPPSARILGTASWDGVTSSPVKVVASIAGTSVEETYSDVNVTALNITSVIIASPDTSDTTTSTDSNSIEIVSPKYADATDSTTSSDEASCLLTVVSSVATPFLLAAAFVMTVLYGTVNNDSTTYLDATVISQKINQTDLTTWLESISLGFGCGAADSITTVDSGAGRIGFYSGQNDANTFTDTVTVRLLIVCDITDETISSDDCVVSQTFPATVEVVDSIKLTDTSTTVAAIGQIDITITSDTVFVYIGQFTFANDSITLTDTSAASVVATPPSEEKPIAAIAEPVRIGMVAEDAENGMKADSISVGMICRRNVMKTGACWQGCDFPVFFPREKDALGRYVDLSGATLVCAASYGGQIVPASATSVNAADGTGQAVFSAVQTAAWPAGVKVKFDGVYKLANGTVYPAGTGEFLIVDPITPTP